MKTDRPRSDRAVRRARPFLARLVFTAAVLSSALALAQGDSMIRIDYTAPSDCPGESTLVAQMLARSHGLRIAAGAERARVVIVKVTKETGRLVGHLTIRDLDGLETEREVTGDTCVEVVSAIAFVGAVALTPTKGAASDRAGAEPPTGDASAPATEAGFEAPDAATAIDAGPALPRNASERRDAGERPDGTTRHWEVAVGVDGSLVNGPGPVTLVAIPAFVEIASARHSVLAPSARVRFERASSSRYLIAGGADFTWTAGTLELCPLRWAPRAFRNDLCVRGEAGTLEATGVGVQPVRTSLRPWWSVGPVVRGLWRALDPVFFELEGSLGVALFRDSFTLNPGGTIFRVPLVEIGVALGAGVRIW